MFWRYADLPVTAKTGQAGRAVCSHHRGMIAAFDVLQRIPFTSEHGVGDIRSGQGQSASLRAAIGDAVHGLKEPAEQGFAGAFRESWQGV